MNWPARLLLVAFCLFTGLGCATGPGDLDKQSFIYSGESRNYAVYKPPGYDPNRAYPTILFLHGLFEGGNDGKAMTKVGIGPAIYKHPDWFKCVVVFAQTSGSWRDPDEQPLAMATLQDAEKRFAIDPNRVVLTGLSTGGEAVWKLGAKYPDKFAALAPLCAYSDYDDVPKLLHTPIWAFHNSIDPFVSSGSTDKMVKKINDAGGDARKTIYTTFGHNCWDATYNTQKVVDWLQNQHK